MQPNNENRMNFFDSNHKVIFSNFPIERVYRNERMFYLTFQYSKTMKRL